METIRINVANKIAVAVGTPLIVCGNSDYQVSFTFDAEWDAYYEKTARFVFMKDGIEKNIDVLFAGTICEVPILTDIDKVTIGVYAGELRTTTGAEVRCKRSVLCGFEFYKEPETDVYNQILEQISKSHGMIEQEIALERARITNLTQLEDGSTTGDAELIDARVGADGVPYETLGEAVRTQFKNVNKGLGQLYPYALDDEVFKIGNITIADGEYKHIYEGGVRVSTLEGFEIPLNAGDVISRKLPITRYNVGFRNPDTSEVSFSDWQYGEYTIPATGNYVFVLSHIETDESGAEYEPVIENVSEFARGLSIASNNRLSNYCKWWKISKTDAKAYTLPEDIFRYGSITLSDNSLKYIEDAVRVSTIEGFEIPLNAGDVITFKSPVSRINPCLINPETGEVEILGWQYGGKYKVTTTGNYVFVLSQIVDNVEVKPDLLSDFSKAFTVTTISDVNNVILCTRISELSQPKETDTHLDEVSIKVHNALEGGDVVFVHFSDTHCGTYPMTLEMTKNHMDKAVKLAETVNADFIIHTGDIIQGDGSSTGSYGSDDKVRYKAIVDGLCGSTVPLLWCQGNNNHDCGVTTDDGYALTKNQVASYIGRLGNELTANAVYNSKDIIKTYYYFDMPLQDCRIIVTDSSDYEEKRNVNGWSDAQVTWLQSVLSDAKEKGLAVLMFSHMPPHSGLTPRCPDSAVNVQSAVKDFIINGGNFIACVHGHTHWDNYYNDEETQIPYICVASDQPVEQTETFTPLGNKSVPEREIGSISEYAYDVYVVNTKTRKTQIFRYGAGTDRTFTY